MQSRRKSSLSGSLFIGEVLFGLLGLRLKDNAMSFFFFGVPWPWRRYMGRSWSRGQSLVAIRLGNSVIHAMWQSNRRIVTTYIFIAFGAANVICQFLQQYGEFQSGESMLWEKLGIWNRRHQFMVDLREGGKGPYTHPSLFFVPGLVNMGYQGAARLL